MNIQRFKHLVALEAVFAGALAEVADRLAEGQDFDTACAAVAGLNPAISYADLWTRARLLARASDRSTTVSGGW